MGRPYSVRVNPGQVAEINPGWSQETGELRNEDSPLVSIRAEAGMERAEKPPDRCGKISVSLDGDNKAKPGNSTFDTGSAQLCQRADKNLGDANSR